MLNNVRDRFCTFLITATIILMLVYLTENLVTAQHLSPTETEQVVLWPPVYSRKSLSINPPKTTDTDCNWDELHKGVDDMNIELDTMIQELKQQNK